MPRKSQVPSEILITTVEAARRLKRSRELIRGFCVSGRLPAIRIGRDWLIPAAAVAEFALLERPIGNPNFGPAKA